MQNAQFSQFFPSSDSPFYCLSVGSAHLDVLAQAIGGGMDKPGSVRIEIGGTAANIAIDCAAFGAKSKILTAFNGSSIGKAVHEHLASCGVEVLAEANPDLGESAFSAHLDSTGEMTSAISCMSVERHSFSQAFLDRAFEDCSLVSLDCNLSSNEALRIAEFARAKKIPVFAAGVSEEKSLRLAEFSHRCFCCFLNRAEALFICARLGLSSAQGLPFSQSGQWLAVKLDCHLIVTAGSAGAWFFSKNGVVEHIPNPDYASEFSGSRLGAGDAFLAACSLFSIRHKMPLNKAAAKAMDLAFCATQLPQANFGAPDALVKSIGKMRDRALIDPLTGLGNRSAAHEAVKNLVPRSKSGESCVAIFDLDHFKSINDTHGHDAGDKALSIFASILKESIRDNDTACRWGGEEFVCLLPSSSPEDALAVAERIRRSVAEQTTVPFPVTVSGGVALWRSPGVELSLDDALKMADEALYTAKRSGRNQVLLHESLKKQSP